MVCRTADPQNCIADAGERRSGTFGRTPAGECRSCRQGRSLQMSPGFPGASSQCFMSKEQSLPAVEGGNGDGGMFTELLYTGTVQEVTL